nr:zinc finger CCCH domain-containing protein 49-like [Tanacetum cinerariifolium]
RSSSKAPMASKNQRAIPTSLTEHEANIESGTSEGGHWKSKSKRRKPTNEEDLAVPWSCEEDPVEIHNIKQKDGETIEEFIEGFKIETGRMKGALEYGYTDIKAAFLAYFMKQKIYVKDPVEIHNIKQKDGETIEEFIERFKIETGRMEGALECMRIFEFMHGVNNPKLVKRLNMRVPNTLKEMMTATAAFIRGETATASKKKVHTPWKSQEKSKQKKSKRRSDFKNLPWEGQGSNMFTPLTKTSKEIFVAGLGKFKPPLPMTNANYDKECKICTRPFKVVRWRPGRDARYKKIQVRDTELSINLNNAIPKRDVNREYFAEEHDRRARAEHIFVVSSSEVNVQEALNALTGMRRPSLAICPSRILKTVGVQVYLKSISNSKIIAKGWIRSLDLDEVVGSEEIGPNWCSKMLLVHELLGLALLFRWCVRMIDDGLWMMT